MRSPLQHPAVARAGACQSSVPGADLAASGYLDTALEYGSSLLKSENFWSGVGGAATIMGAIAKSLGD
ncbi:MAG: hypothetical protein AAFU80_02165 [Pseudomonadota bacterium]